MTTQQEQAVCPYCIMVVYHCGRRVWEPRHCVLCYGSRKVPMALAVEYALLGYGPYKTMPRHLPDAQQTLKRALRQLRKRHTETTTCKTE